MFFILSKILAFLFNPLTWVVALLVLALFMRNHKKFIIIALATIYLIGNSFLLDEVLRLWEWPATRYDKLEKYDAAIVLGGGMATWDDTNQKINFVNSTDRFLQAVDLYKRGIVKKIIISGGKATIIEDYGIESELIKKYLVLIGIPDSCIYAETKSANTYQNAVLTKELLVKEKIHGNFLLITSATHMRRSVSCFEKQGIKVTPYSTDRLAGIRKYNFDHLFIPNIDTFQRWNVLLHEWFGLVAYKMNGYI